jgi:hypothetical protein
MSSLIPFRLSRRAASERTALDTLVAAYGRVHYEHVSPLVGCYLCLHDEPRRRRQLAKAA